MKSRKIILVAILVVSSVIGFTALQDNVSEEVQPVVVNEFSSEIKTITVEIADGIGSGDNG